MELIKTYVGCYRKRPFFSPYELKSNCKICGTDIWITVSAPVVKQRLNADGYACFECLDEHPELVARINSVNRSKQK